MTDKSLIKMFIIGIFTLPILYSIIGFGMILNYCNWKPTRFNDVRFAMYYNYKDIVIKEDEFVRERPSLIKKFDKPKYMNITVYVRRPYNGTGKHISQDVMFSLWPFNVVGFNGYID